MKIDIVKLLKVSARIAFAISIACIFLLFFPERLLPFDIIKLREEYGLWIFVLMVVSVALLLSYIGEWLLKKFRSYINKHKTWGTYKYILKHLSNAEKKYLENLYNNHKTTIMIDLNNPVVKKLETFQIVSMASGTCIAEGGMAPGFVQPWVFDLIDKHPEYLNVTNDNDKEEQNNA
ncbi:MAG: hypothetical protein HFE65_01770 [Clostridiales bacterium]|nr:hypothetical protein [Clostridiales bacterium]